MVKPQTHPPPNAAESGVGERQAECGAVAGSGGRTGRGWGQQPPTCLGSQREGCVAFFVLLVHIQERTAAE